MRSTSGVDGLAGCVALACLAAPVPGVAAAYGTSARAWASAAHASPATSAIDHPVFAADSIESANGHGAVATATYTASLASATLATEVGARADPADSYYNSAAAEVNALGFNDTLSFVIPAGTYAAPVVVRLHGFSLGALSSLGCTSAAGTTCSNGYHVLSLHAGGSYGEDDFNLRRDVNAGTANAATDFDARFTLEVPILNPTTLLAPLVSDVAISGSLITKGGAIGTHGYPGGAALTMFSGDAFAGFSSLEVADGITWTSASGVFLSQPVPEPAPLALWLAGGAVLAWIGRRRRQ